MHIPYDFLNVRARSWSLLASFCGISAALLLSMLNIISPDDIGPNGILAFFFLAYLFFVSVVLLALKAVRRMFRLHFSIIKGMYLACTVAFAPIMLLALNTLDQLQLIDVVLVIAFECLAIFYIWRRL